MKAVRLAVSLVVFLSIAAGAYRGPSARAMGETSPVAEASEVEIDISSPTRSRELRVRVHPTEGVAVAGLFYDEGNGIRRGVTYSVAIPKRPFDGSLNVSFPGIGEIVGSVTATKARGPVEQAKICDSRYPGEGATFEGHLLLDGPGSHPDWQATKVEASITPACGAPTEGGNGLSSLLEHLDEGFGPGFMGDFFTFFGVSEAEQRRVQFIVVGDRFRNRGTVIAYDSERLPDGVVVQRWVERAPVVFERTVAFPRANDPSRLVFTPPAPFFGRATYQQRTGKLTGSLGVHFLDLSLRIAHPPLNAVLEDEEPRGPSVR